MKVIEEDFANIILLLRNYFVVAWFHGQEGPLSTSFNFKGFSNFRILAVSSKGLSRRAATVSFGHFPNNKVWALHYGCLSSNPNAA